MGDWFEDIFGKTEREEAAAAAREGSLRDAQFFGHGGADARVAVRPDGSIGIDSDLGNLSPLRNALLRLAGNGLGGGKALPKDFLSAADQATGDLGQVNPGASGSFDFANRLLKGGLFPELQSKLQSGVKGALNQASQPLSRVADEQLSLLRQQAQPFEERAFTGLQDNLFATGRMGSTGGSLQTEAFARGLAQADLGRQMAAFDTARGVQNDAASRAGAFGNQLSGLRGLEDSLVNSGFGRALQAAGLNTDRALSRFNVAGSVLDSRLRNQSTQQGLGLQALAGIQGIDAQGMANAQQALQASVARSNSQLGIGSNLAGVASSAGGFGKALLSLLAVV